MGSEMCIRDSSGADAPPGSGRSGRFEAHLAHRVRRSPLLSAADTPTKRAAYACQSAAQSQKRWKDRVEATQESAAGRLNAWIWEASEVTYLRREWSKRDPSAIKNLRS